MKILFITCALLAITIGSFADNAAVKPADKPVNQQSNPVAEQTTLPQTDSNKTESTTTAVPPITAVTTKPNPEPKPTVHPSAETTTSHTTATAENKTTIPTTLPDKPTSSVAPTTTAKPTTTTQASTTKPGTTTTTPSVTTNPATNVTDAHSTTAHPDTTMASPPTVVPVKERHFDGLSFLGGMILTLCLMSLAAFSWKLYKDRRDGHYRTL